MVAKIFRFTPVCLNSEEKYFLYFIQVNSCQKINLLPFPPVSFPSSQSLEIYYYNNLHTIQKLLGLWAPVCIMNNSPLSKQGDPE